MWQLQKNAGIPLYQGIVELIMSAIKNGQLLPGEKVPSERKLAERLQVNRSTVVHALDELVARGVIIRKQGSGTIVNEGKWGLFTGPTTNWRHYLSQGSVNSSQVYLEKIQTLLHSDSEVVIDGFTGELPLALIPSIELPNISWKQFLQEEALQDELGYLPLRQIISKMSQINGQSSLTAEELLITSGAQQALFLIIQVLLQTGDAVAIEEPSFFYPLSLFQAAGIRLYGIPIDQDGMQVEFLEQEIIRHKIKMVLVNPTFQNPMGTNMSLERRQQLVEVCRHQQVPIVEDDVFGQLHFEGGSTLPTLKKLDSENVIYIGSLSKILGSTTKIGWLSAPPAVLKKLAEARKEMDFTLSIFPQVLAENALNQLEYPQKITALKNELQSRSQSFIDAIEKYAAQDFIFDFPQGGYYIWLRSTIPNLKKTDYDLLLQRNLATAPSFIFGLKEGAIRLNFARLSQQEAIATAKILHEVSEIWRNQLC